uniref:Uncharacterized protein n=1 Tax=Avena sativa TaxID=4498 RepID=A0ACD5UUE0_AVESA
MSGLMDWHAWLSSARLEPALVHQYALLLTRNELEAGDAAYFDHEFLRCMGISVAKHRLEILKLARPRRRHRFSSSAASLSRILAAVDRVARYVRALVRRRGEESSAALVLVPSCQQQPDGVDFGHAGFSSGCYKQAPKRTRSSNPKGAAAAITRARRPSGSFRGAATVHAMRDVESGGEHTVMWDRLFQDLNPN